MLCGLEAQVRPCSCVMATPNSPAQVLRKALREEGQGSGCSNLEQQNPEVTQEAWGREGRIGGNGDWSRQRTWQEAQVGVLPAFSATLPRSQGKE